MKNVMLIGIVSLSLVGCNAPSAPATSSSDTSSVSTDSGSTDTPAAAPVHTQYLAQNVIMGVRPSNQVALNAKTVVDTTTKIYASDIILAANSQGNGAAQANANANTLGHLQSTDLATALSTEIAPDLATVLKANTWQITHKMAHANYDANTDFYGSYTRDAIDNSTITFNADGTLTLNKCFLVAGQYACANGGRTDGYETSTPPTYEVVNNGSLIVNYQSPSSCNNGSCSGSLSWSIIVQVGEVNSKRIVLLNPNIGLNYQEVVVLTTAQ